MTDIMLDRNGDIKVSASGDISLTESVRQAVIIHLRWMLGEWRLDPELGFPWYEEVFVKNPNIPKLRQLMRSEIMKCQSVTQAEVTDVIYSKAERSAKFVFVCAVGEEIFKEEIIFYDEVRK